MRRFHCEHCGNEVHFETSTCPVCHSLLGFVPAASRLRELTATGDGATYTVADDPTGLWRCLNAAWGCNWVLPAATGATWCRSCALTRGRPDEGRPHAIAAWAQAEAAKRRLVYQLDRLGLPVEPRSPATPDGLTFDLVHVPGERGLTGHLDGVVTIDRAESDPVRRDELRRRLGEPYRTLIGNLRHEIAHHYWSRIVARTARVDAFRTLFGDERADYQAALAAHYDAPGDTWDERRYVSRYAQAHPHEDWAETFAHYLHVVDLVDTAGAHGAFAGAPSERTDVVNAASFRQILHRWRPIARAIDDLADSVGSPHLYPFDPAGAVVDKLEFVHACVMESSGRPEGPRRPSSRPRDRRTEVEEITGCQTRAPEHPASDTGATRDR